MHSTINCSHFEIVYSFNSLTYLDLIPLAIDERVSSDDNRKAQVMKAFHESEQHQIRKKRKRMSNMYSKLIKKEKKVIFEINDWVLVHMSSPVHGSVRFSLNHKNQLDLVTQIFKNSN
jgi:hypothetical protein